MSLRLSESERDAYRAEAKNGGTKVTDWIRGSLLAVAETTKRERATRPPPVADPHLMKELVYIRNILEDVHRLIRDGKSSNRPHISWLITRVEWRLRNLARANECS